MLTTQILFLSYTWYSLRFAHLFTTFLALYFSPISNQLKSGSISVCPESIWLHTMKNRDIYCRRYKIQETLYIGQCTVPFKVAPWHLTQLSQCLFCCTEHSAKSSVGIAISCPVLFSSISLTVWNLFPFKGEFSFGKSQTLPGTKSGL